MRGECWGQQIGPGVFSFFVLGMNKYREILPRTRTLADLSRTAAGRGAAHLNKTAVPMWRGTEDQLLIKSRLVRGIHPAHSNTFNKKDILGLPLSIWDANKHTHCSYPTLKLNMHIHLFLSWKGMLFIFLCPLSCLFICS